MGGTKKGGMAPLLFCGVVPLAGFSAVGITDQCALRWIQIQLVAQTMDGAWVGFAGGVISAPDSCDEGAQSMVLKKLFNPLAGVIANHGTDHPCVVQLV